MKEDEQEFTEKAWDKIKETGDKILKKADDIEDEIDDDDDNKKA